MLDLKKAVMPSAVEVDGIFYKIHTDFRYWLRFYSIFEENEKPLVTDFVFMFDGKTPENMVEGFEKLKEFARPKNKLPRDTGNDGSEIIYDFEIDADLIYSAFYEVYKIDLIDEKLKLHWWKFLALFNGLHGTKLNDIMGYRCYNPDEKADWKKSMQKMKAAWEIRKDDELDAEEQAMLDDFNRRTEGKG